MYPQPADTSAAAPAQWDGITPPTRRGGSGRHVLDVLSELGFIDVFTAQRAREEGKLRGIAPDKLLIEQGALTEDQLSRAIAERHGLDHLDLTQFPVDMAAANLLGTTAAKRYEAVPVAYVDER